LSAAIPLAGVADAWLRSFARESYSAALADIDGETLLGERAVLGGFRIPSSVSAGGGCRLYHAEGGVIALNLARATDRELLPALFETDAFDVADDAAIASVIGASDVEPLVARGRAMGMAIAAENEGAPPGPACRVMVESLPAASPTRSAPRVLDLSALWAGPLAAHLLWLAGAEVIKVESRTRPDAMRDGDAEFFALLNQGKASVVLDFTTSEGRDALRSLIARSDVVIEAARPRALAQMGIDADAIVRTTPGLAWITITGHGAEGEAANWVGFGDDCGVAGGLSAALRAASGRSGFVGDAIADPLTGIRAAGAAWSSWASGKGARFGLSMRGVVAEALAEARSDDAAGLDRTLVAWAAAAASPFPTVRCREIGAVSPLGADTHAEFAPC
jgi:hypothetical protein